MGKIIIDGREVECREGEPVLQAALEAGLQIPHYCYHPGLTVVASCRLCLMEMKMPHPKTKEMVWAPKLFPACQTPAKDGMEVRFDSDAVRDNVRHVMEYYLLNHPLDCPVCDKAGECYLQDYSEEFGSATSRMVEEKYKNPKKDIGSKTLLYSDRCVMCSRCVRFCDEIVGTGELAIASRGSRSEIDVFPGEPLENALQGNVVDLCPVGALLSKDFLFQQRVWLLKSTPSVSPADSRGATIFIDHNEGRIFRIRPRYNEKVNEWWISDEQRFSYHYVHRPDRLNEPQRRGDGGLEPTRWEALGGLLADGLRHAGHGNDGAAVAAVLSPFMSCEEAWLLIRFVRQVAPQALLALGPVPVHGVDQQFPKGFVIKAEKCPNRRGIETLLKHAGGPTATWQQFIEQATAGKLSAVYLTGGYPEQWVTPELQGAAAKVAFVAIHDLFPSPLTETATVVVPAASWAEREGSFMNDAGLLQAFERAIAPPDGVKFDGQFYFELAGERGLYRGAKVRERMAADLPEFAEVFVPKDEPDYSH